MAKFLNACIFNLSCYSFQMFAMNSVTLNCNEHHLNLLSLHKTFSSIQFPLLTLIIPFIYCSFLAMTLSAFFLARKNHSDVFPK